MRLGFNLNIEQIQKLVMTPELKQAIQILQFNHQELDQFIEDQILVNPVLEIGSPNETEVGKKQETEKKENKEEVDWKEYLQEYDDISYRQTTYNKDKIGRAHV